MREIGNIPLLQRNKEYKLGVKILHLKQKIKQYKKNMIKSTGGKMVTRDFVKVFYQLQKCRHIMVSSNLRLVFSIAMKYNRVTLPFEDLVMEGNIGLLRAVDRFDPHKGFKFSTFAVWWIKQSILKAIKDKGSLVRIPAHIEGIYKELRALSQDYSDIHGYEPGIDTIAALKKISIQKAYSLMTMPQFVQSIHEPINESGEELGSTIAADTDSESQFAYVENNELRTALFHALKRLSKHEQAVIIQRYGLYDGEPKILDAVGNALGLTRERIRQIQNTALKKLKKFVNSSGLDNYL